MAGKKKETVDTKVKETYEELKKKWLPLFQAKYGHKAIIKEIELLHAGIKGAGYGVMVNTADGKEQGHYVRTLFSDDPMMVDGVLTKAGQNYVDYWSEYGKVMAKAYSGDE
ncbi:MAG: hypothetical protein PHO02_01015 [Candidatus Nanoarchaeia archaeon]|nr:hypothetical protein [Candidatus Nanoarchaeia archaeon]